MCTSLIFQDIIMISRSSFCQKDKDDLINTVHKAGLWTTEQKNLYKTVMKEWERNHPRIPRISADGLVTWIETIQSDPEILN
ncbi:MAG: hypothetical protein WCJ95_03850 [Mariniphaga sp.]